MQLLHATQQYIDNLDYPKHTNMSLGNPHPPTPLIAMCTRWLLLFIWGLPKPITCMSMRFEY